MLTSHLGCSGAQMILVSPLWRHTYKKTGRHGRTMTPPEQWKCGISIFLTLMMKIRELIR